MAAGYALRTTTVVRLMVATKNNMELWQPFDPNCQKYEILEVGNFAQPERCLQYVKHNEIIVGGGE